MNNEPLTINYKPVIGLEVHVELKTKSKMFCGCLAEYFGEKPNTNTCPVCLGLPGALPVPNKKAIEWCLMVGLALNCKIPLLSKFDRKNYFYPDLPKGYQISQYDQPFAINGSLKLKITEEKTIRIRRVHMEEDTAKLIHQGENSLIDFNRSGVPLVEIVTEPDFENAEEVVEYLKKLQQIVRYLDVSDADMEKGNMRLEPNISLQIIVDLPRPSSRRTRPSDSVPNYKVEVKNINSFSFVEKAINYEIERQEEILKKNKIPVQETRGWDEKKGQSVSQRTKEEAHDYRYFPEPDIPPISWSESEIENLKSKMPQLPDIRYQKLREKYGLSEYNSEILTREKETADYFEQAVKDGKKLNIRSLEIANFIINRKPNLLSELPSELISKILSAKNMVSLESEKLDEIIKKILKNNNQAVLDYKKGKTNAIMFLIGAIIREAKQKLDTRIVKKALEKMLE